MWHWRPIPGPVLGVGRRPELEVAVDWESVARRLAAMEPERFLEHLAGLPAGDQDEALRMRFRFDQAAFARWCWPERFELPFNACHHSLFDNDKRHYRVRETVRSAIAAPRGLGKSTLSSFVDPLHDVVYGLEAFIVISAATSTLADELVGDLRDALVDRESPLWALYGPFEVVGGKTDFVVKVAGRHSTRVLARSAAQPIRGVKHKGERPTKIIVDDGERSDRVRSAQQRAHQWRWLTDDVLKAGRKQGGTRYHVRGTVLHTDSMLATCLTNPGWTGERWASIVTWPDRTDLWERCGSIWKDLTLGEHRQEAAKAFYAAHRAEMDAGAQVLDPVAEPLFRLYELIWSEGLASFLREKQNQPRDPSSSFFDSSRFARCQVRGSFVETADGRTVPLSALRTVARLDPIPGRELGTLSADAGSGAGDYAAIAVIGRDEHGFGYLLDVWMKRARDVDQLEAMWSLCERWGVERVSIESNGFQRLFGRDFRRMQNQRRRAGQFWEVAIIDQTSSMAKEDRIARLDAPTSNGWLQFEVGIHPEVLRQFDEFPNGDHDDAPDAIEGAWQMTGGSPRMAQRPAP